MNAERLLALYDRVAEAPDAVVRLRRFVLDLAVRGKLVEQDPADELAVKLLKRIVAEKARLVKAGKIRKPRGVAPLNPEEFPFPIPRGWAWTQVAQLGVISPRNEALGDHEASFVPMPMVPAEYGASHTHEVRPWGEIKKGYTHFAEGDVGLAKITPCFENGKSTVFRNLTGGIGSGTTELHVVRPLFVDADYIVLFLKSPHFIGTGVPRMTGTAGQKRVPTEYFTSSPFPLPPLAEQHRIVSKVDELMALCDRMEEARNEREETRDQLTTASLARLSTPGTDARTFRAHARFAVDVLPALSARADQVAHLRQTILNLAVRGKLVEQDPADEPAAELLKRIEERRVELMDKQRPRRKKPVDLVSDENALELPVGWSSDAFANLIDPVATISYGVLVPGPNVDDGVPFVRVQDLALIDHPERPSKAIAREIEGKYSRTRLKGGEILLCVVGSIGKVGIVPRHWAGANIARAVARISLVDLIDRKYVILFLRSDRAQGYFEDATRTLAQPTLNVGLIEKLPTPVPPLAEQRRIVAKVDELMDLCDRLEAGLAASDATRVRLLESLLHEALTPTANMDLASTSPVSASPVDTEIAAKPLPSSAVQPPL